MCRRLLICAASVAALLAPGCSDDGDTFITTTSLVSTRADAIATRVDESWSENYQSINIKEAEDIDEFKVFKCADGAGLISWAQGDDGDEHAYWAFFDRTGALVNQVHIRGFGFVDDEPFDDTVQTMQVLWLPGGDAMIVFVAEQDSDPTIPADSDSDRVWVARFHRSLANTPWDATGTINYGFEEAVAVDTNVTGTDDNGADNIFVATNFLDGTYSFEESLDLDDTLVLGDRGDNRPDVAFVGWVHRIANGAQRIEGYFVDLRDADGDGDRFEFTTAAPIAIDLPGLDGTESVDSDVLVSGTEMLFEYTDNSAVPADRRLFLVRIDDSTNPPTLEAPIEITRGTNVNTAVSFNVRAFVGDGYRVLNGQSASWILMTQNGFEDGAVTQPDQDLVIAQVAANGTVEIDEFDHNPAAAADANNVDTSLLRIQLCRGATRAFVYYGQRFDATGGPATDRSAFVRAVRLDGAQALADNVSAEATLNDTHDTTGDFDTDVTRIEVADSDPFCGPCCNNDTSYAAFVQEIEGDIDGRTLRARLVTIDSISANPITITLGAEEVIVANGDTGHPTSLSGSYDFFVVPGAASTGEGIVYYANNGNNEDDDTAVGSFDEPRPFIYASALPNGHSITTPVQIGSDSATPTLLPFPDYKTLDDDSVELEFIATPNTPAQRDFTFDRDEACPRYVQFVFGEFFDNYDEDGATYRGRTMDLASLPSSMGALDRFRPALDALPHNIGNLDGSEFEDLDESDAFLASDGNDVLFIYNIGPHSDDTEYGGRFFVNTYTASGWSRPALLTNDHDGVLDPPDESDEAIEQDGENQVWGFVPGCENGCPTATGSWFFWFRWTDTGDSSIESDALQARRIRGLNLPDR